MEEQNEKHLVGFLRCQKFCGTAFWLGKEKQVETPKDTLIDSLFEGLEGKKIKVTVEEVEE